ncbi:MAG: helix-turn-helix transcriptional regulator [Caulobacteraceae bacterium]
MAFDNDDDASIGGERILRLLKRIGPAAASELARSLSITGEAARQQLGRLAREGLVRAEAARGRVGRPASIWALTERAEAAFPDSHGELTVRMIEAVRTRLGEAALAEVVGFCEETARRAYREALADAGGLGEKVARLTQLRAAEGYMAEWRAEAGGNFLLFENHCPICAAARACQGFCRAELQVFAEVLGSEAEIERIDHILLGARRCAYRISPKSFRSDGHG